MIEPSSTLLDATIDKIQTDLIRRFTRMDHIATADNIIDRLAAHITNKPKTIEQLEQQATTLPSSDKLINAVIQLAMVEPKLRPHKIEAWLAQHIAWLEPGPRKQAISLITVLLKHLEDWLEYSEAHKVLTREQISARIYRQLNFLIFALGTVGIFYKNIVQPDMPFSVEFYFVVAGSYTLLDHIVDDPESNSSVITKQAICIFNWYITQLEQMTTITHEAPQYPSSGLSRGMAEYNKAIHWLINLLLRTWRDTPIEQVRKQISIMRLCLDVEIQCYLEQKLSSQSSDEIIRLGILKGLSTGYLLARGRLTDLFSKYSVLSQLMDDLGDYEADTAAGIRTFSFCYQNIEEYALLVGEYLAEVVDDYILVVNEHPDYCLGGPGAAEYVIVGLILHWLYSMCKCHRLHQLVNNIAHRMGLDKLINPERILTARNEKHCAKLALWKIIKEFRA